MLGDKLAAALQRFNAGDIGGVEHLCGEILRESPQQADALHLLGVARLMSGRAADAATALRRALAAKPGDVAILENLGLACLAVQDHVQAESILRQALAAGSSSGLTYMRLGMALGLQRRFAEALSLLQTAAEKSPNDVDVLLNLGNAHCQLDQWQEAVGIYQRALVLQPQNADAHFNLGTLFRQIKRLDEAEASFQRVLQIAPGYAEAHINLGLVYAEQGRLDDAIGSYRRALELAPQMVQAHNNLGNVLMLKGARDEAVASYERALAIDPQHPDAYVNLGAVRAVDGDLAAARMLYEKALQYAPADFDAHRGLAVALQIAGRRQEALNHFRQAFEINPRNADTCSDLGRVYRDMSDLGEAAQWFRKALAIDTNYVEAHYELAETLKVGGRFDEAVAGYERALAIKADYFPALSGLIYVRQHMCAWDGIEALWERSRREAIGRAGSGVTPFSVLSQPTTPEEQLACARAWAQQQAAPFARQATVLGFDFAHRKANERLRIGYLSWDFHAHATSYLIAELFELHDRRRFEIFAYSMGPEDGSEIRQRVRRAVDHFVDVAGESETAAAQKIYADNIDILVDLKGYTQGARTGIMALRPAPLQLNWLGFPGSMGAEFIDYIVADPFVIPEGFEKYYSEQVLRLPDCYQSNDRHRPIGEQAGGREACGLPPAGFVFCCFNLTHKILPDVFACWMRILAAVPGSVLWLLEANPWAVENLRRVAAAHGVAPERLVFAPMKPLAEHLARYRLANLALDTFPYTSHTTASDALWAGCPLVTRTGATFASRVAGSLLRNAGLPDLVTDSLDGYEKLVLALAGDPLQLGELRQRLQANRDSCALFDTPRFVRNLEGAYESIVEK